MSLVGKNFSSDLTEFILTPNSKSIYRRIIMNSMNIHRYKNGDS